MILALHVKIQILINAYNAMYQITVKNNLMETLMVNVYAILAILMMDQIIYVSNAIIVGKIKLNNNN